MILKWVKLNNIRSYVSETVSFPSGSLLLCGDIGSGKSTILYSIEFALFGLLRGTVGGDSLLRHGAQEGSVELCFEISGSEIIIKRYLKRMMGNVSQAAGYLIVNGVKIDGTAIELKSKILTLIGYPESLLTKSKSLIFRYTVYTPQEQMKHILFDDVQNRLDTIRRIFGIDKYKMISDNASLYAKFLRDRKKELSGVFLDLDERIRDKNEITLRLLQKDNELSEHMPKIDELKLKLSVKFSILQSKQEHMKRLVEIKSEYSSIVSSLNENQKRIADIKSESIILSKEIAELKEHALNYGDLDADSLKNEIKNLEDEYYAKQKEYAMFTERLNNINIASQNDKKEILLIEKYKEDIALYGQELSKLNSGQDMSFLELQERLKKANTELIDISSFEKEYDVKVNESSSLKERIVNITNCPTCLQPVSEDHKHSIIFREDEKSALFMAKKNEYSREKELLLLEVSRLNAKISMSISNQEKTANIKALIESRTNELSRLSQKEISLSSIEKEKSDIMLKLSGFDIESTKEKILQKRKLLEFAALRKAMLVRIDEKTEALARLENSDLDIARKIEAFNQRKSELYLDYEKLKDSHEEYKRLREEYDSLKEKENSLNIGVASIQKEIEQVKMMIRGFDNEIARKTKAKNSYQKVTDAENWISQYFINLMSSMERQVLHKVYREFNSYFTQWFNMLIDDELLNARLGADFSPVISQNGYEAFLENLSGGEKTAIALAYRLALNKVINDVVSTIKTSDLIILDEPTDGFSSEQLDKVREVLIELGVKQTIIVSHESKIESFVDNVMRISKREHESMVE